MVKGKRIHSVKQAHADEEHEVANVTSETPVVYPSVVLALDGHKIPICHQVMEPSDAYHHLLTSLNGHVWNDVIVATFMIAVIKEDLARFTAVSLEKWESFGRVFCEAGETVTVLDLFRATEPIVKIGAIQGAVHPSDDKKRKSMFFALLMILRKALTKQRDATYGAKVAQRLNSFFATNRMKAEEPEMTAIATHMSTENLTTNYKRIICVLDMFFFKFPLLEYSKMRMATLTTRYHGCVALTGLGDIAHITGLEPHELSILILSDPVANDMRRISYPNQETGNIYGYFPYHLDLELTSRSPYSLTANPSLHLWLHTIGCVLGHTRSINAQMPESVDLAGTFHAAVVTGVTFTQGSVFEQQFTEEREEADDIRARSQALLKQQEEEELDEEEEEEEPKGAAAARIRPKPPSPIMKKASEVLRLLLTDSLPQSKRNYITNIANGLSDSKPGTVGYYFYKIHGQSKKSH